MALLEGFIGIDRYSDPAIRDLVGASRDATALWALFSDSYQSAKSVLVTDDCATLANVRKLFDETLGAAGPDDVVILSFAGHGSPDHRLVVSDSAMADLPGTSLSMAELSDRFRASKARAVLMLLDCCFSGAAPARVLDGGFAHRDPGFQLYQVAGRGRILMSASAMDEPALEDPNSRHGLFTKALMDVLTREQATVDVLEMAREVSQRVRSEASSLGYTQTPTLFGHVEGELHLAPLKRGEVFAKHFPELAPVVVGSNFSDLRAFGLPDTAIQLWTDRYANGFNNLQLEALNSHQLLLGNSLLVIAPTSAGKTFIGEVAAIKAVAEGKKAAFLLPYKALVNEKYEEFQEQYGARLGLRVVRCSGDWRDQAGSVIRGKYDLAFFTYETFLGLSLSHPHIAAQLGLVVVDEAQFMSNATRGIVVELILTNLLRLRQKGVKPQLVMLSAVIGHTNGLEHWLGCRLLEYHARPVPLIEGVLDRRGQLRRTGTLQLEQLLEPHLIRQRRQEPSSQDVIVPLVDELVRKGEKVLIFRSTRGAATGCAKYLARDLGLAPAQGVIQELPRHDRSRTSQDLVESLAGGVAFHTSDLSREERALIERAFRDPKGEVRVLVATTTVAAGVNTPASTVIIVETNFFGEDGPVPFTVAEYKNMAGRAGRLGFETEGKSVLLADNDFERDGLFHRYVEGTPEPVVSSFDPNDPGTWLLRLFAQVDRIGRQQAADLIVSTFGGYLESIRNPNWVAVHKPSIEQLIWRFETDGLVAEQDGMLSLTMLGRACGQSPLSLESLLRLIEMLKRLGPALVTAENVMAVLQALPQQDQDYTPLARGAAEARLQAEVARRLGPQISHALQYRADDDRVYYRRCKRALILHDWISGRPLEEIEAAYSPNPFTRVGPGDIRGYADGTRFYLESALRIAVILFPENNLEGDQAQELLRRLDVGLPQAAMGLIQLPQALTRGEYLALHGAGIGNADAITVESKSLVEQLLGAATAKALLAGLKLIGIDRSQ